MNRTIFFSFPGSSDGFIRLWRVFVSTSNSVLRALYRIPVPKGTVNSLEFSPDGTTLVAAIGPSHKLGRWFVEKKAKSIVLIIKFNDVVPLKTTVANDYMQEEEEEGDEDMEDEVSEDGSVDSGRGISNDTSNEDASEESEQEHSEDDSEEDAEPSGGESGDSSEQESDVE